MVERPKKKLKARKPPSSLTSLEKPPPFSISPSDLDSLDEFCNAFDYDKISMETWSTCLSDLEVRVPLWISPDTAAQGDEITVKFCRRILNSSGNGILKEVIQIVLSIPPGTKHGSTITWPGYGDRLDSVQGDLLVTIHVRNLPNPS
jgi:hypothetical protein